MHCKGQGGSVLCGVGLEAHNLLVCSYEAVNYELCYWNLTQSYSERDGSEKCFPFVTFICCSHTGSLIKLLQQWLQDCALGDRLSTARRPAVVGCPKVEILVTRLAFLLSTTLRCIPCVTARTRSSVVLGHFLHLVIIFPSHPWWPCWGSDYL